MSTERDGRTAGLFSSRLTDEDRQTIQWIGSKLGQVLTGRYEEVPPLDRKDELGILANMVSRVSRELRTSRRRDEERRQALEQKVHELEQARAEQERLLADVRELSSPMLPVQRGVLLVPVIGRLDVARMELLQARLLARVVEARVHAVILDLTGVVTIDEPTAGRLLGVARALGLLGARVVLCGMSPPLAQAAIAHGVDFSALIVRGPLHDGLAAALAVRGAPRAG